MKQLILIALLATALCGDTLYEQLKEWTKEIKVIVFANDDWLGDKILPSNDDHIEACEDLEQAHPEVTCIIVDGFNDETVWPLMDDANMVRENTPCIMVHQSGRGKWYFGPNAIDLTKMQVEASIK